MKQTNIIEQKNKTIPFLKDNKIYNKDSSPNDEFVRDIEIAIAKKISNNLSRKIKIGLQKKVEEGIYPGNAPLGYRNNILTKKIDIDNKKAIKIKEVFENLANGEVSKRDLVNISTNLGISKNTLYRTIRNPFYYGDFIFNKKQYHGKHKAIVIKEVWNKANKNLSEVLK